MRNIAQTPVKYLKFYFTVESCLAVTSLIQPPHYYSFFGKCIYTYEKDPLLMQPPHYCGQLMLAHWLYFILIKKTVEQRYLCNICLIIVQISKIILSALNLTE